MGSFVSMKANKFWVNGSLFWPKSSVLGARATLGREVDSSQAQNDTGGEGARAFFRCLGRGRLLGAR